MSNLIVYLLIGLGTLILVSNLVDFPALITKVIFKKPQAHTNTQSIFLEIISLWYQLKNKCDELKLSTASKKLDEVFPLLNQVLENDDENN